MSGRMELGPAQRPSLWRLPAVRRLLALTLLGFSSFFLTLASLPSWAVRGGVPAGSAGLVTAAMLTCTVLVQLAVPALTRRLAWPGCWPSGWCCWAGRRRRTC
jgi:hypothetical protein